MSVNSKRKSKYTKSQVQVRQRRGDDRYPVNHDWSGQTDIWKPNSSVCACDGGCPRCESIQAKSQPGETNPVGPGIQEQIRSLRGGGEPLTPKLRGFFEPRLGRDLSEVRLHTGGQVGEMAKDLNARAFTVGRNIVFGEGQYASESEKGTSLLAHELVHVLQQRHTRQTSSLWRRSDVPDDEAYLGISRKELKEVTDVIPNTSDKPFYDDTDEKQKGLFYEEDSKDRRRIDDYDEKRKPAIKNIIDNDALILYAVDRFMGEFKRRLRQDRDEFFIRVESGIGWTTEEEKNTREAILLKPSLLEFLFPLWNETAPKLGGEAIDMRWWLRDDITGSYTRYSMSYSHDAEWDPVRDKIAIPITYRWGMIDPEMPIIFSRLGWDTITKRVVHEFQHHFDKELYDDLNVGWADDLVRFKREYRARRVARQAKTSCVLVMGDEFQKKQLCVKDLPSSEGYTLNDKEERYKALLDVLVNNTRYRDPDTTLLQVYISYPDFRRVVLKFIHDFEDSRSMVSFNPYNSPRLERLYQFITHYWNTVTLAGQERPWPTEVDNILSDFRNREIEVVQCSDLWRGFIEQNLQEDAEVFWSKVYALEHSLDKD